MNKELLDKQHCEFGLKTHELTEKVAALDQFGYKKLYDELMQEKEEQQQKQIHQVINNLSIELTK